MVLYLLEGLGIDRRDGLHGDAISAGCHTRQNRFVITMTELIGAM
jgi:hypothetical protein